MPRRSKQGSPPPEDQPAGLFLARARLFARLDGLAGSAVWLQGPTGAGKTVLLRTYTGRSGYPTLWVPVDTAAGGADGFFAALVRAAEGAGIPDLPHFAGEHRKAPADLVRLCVARITERLPGALIVIDDAHRLLPSFATLLGALIEACCGDLRLLLAGQDLPLGLESHIASARLVVIGHEQLAFDERESLELAQRVGAGAELARAMHATTSGWAAGLMVALQLGQGVNAQVAQRRMEGPLASLVHSGVLSGIPPQAVDALAALASARRIPPDLARAGAPWSDAVAELERLSERGLFVEREVGGDLRLHDLLCNALRACSVDAPMRSAAVDALAATGRLELALACLLAMPAPGERLSEWLAAYGEALLMRDDVGSLAARVLEVEDRLPGRVLFWSARAALATDLGLADAMAERAYVASVNDAAASGAFLRCCCGAGLLAAQVLLDARRIEAWLARLGALPEASKEELERAPLYEASARLAEHVLRPSRPNTDDIYDLHQVLCRALLRQQPAAEAVLAASLAAYSLQQLQRRQSIVPLLAEIESAPWFPDVPDHALVDWHINKGFLLIGVGHVESGTASFEAAAQLARQQGLALLLRSSLVGLARSSMMMGSVAAAQAALQEAEAVDVNPGLHRRVNELIVKAGLELARANPLRALGALDSAQALLSGGGISHSPALQRARVQVLCALGRHDEAFSFGQDCVKASQGAARDLLECDLVLLTALHAWSTDEGRATECFDRALETVERHGWSNFLLLLPAEAGLVASRALQRGRAVAVIRDAIRERRLPAPSNEGPRWPWPLRVFVFAGLRLERFDEVVPFQGKVQKKPLELLKFLACSRDQQADHASVCAALWSDADDSAARRSLEMATARLRDMLGNPNWVRVADGRTRLDPAYVWCDVQAVHRLCREAEGAGHDRLSAARIDEIVDGLLALYRGVLLAGEDESPWVIGARERVRGEFVRAVRSAAMATQTLEQHERALELLERAVATEPLAEELAQRLMKAHLQHDQPAEAMRVYRQLRQMLSVLLGTQPAAESDRLRDQALRQQQERSTT